MVGIKRGLVMIKIQQLQHHFGSHKVIHNFNLDISKGEIVTFIGKWLRESYFTHIIVDLFSHHLVVSLLITKLNNSHLQIV